MSADAYWIEGRSKKLEKNRGKRGGIRYFDALRLAEELRTCQPSVQSDETAKP